MHCLQRHPTHHQLPHSLPRVPPAADPRRPPHGAAPDLPPELAPFFAVYAGANLPPEQLQLDRDQSVLLAHFAGEPLLTPVA